MTPVIVVATRIPAAGPPSTPVPSAQTRYAPPFMSTETCRACGSLLPPSGFCRDCGEDHRGWYARLGAGQRPESLQEQATEIRQMQGKVRRQRTGVQEELARLTQHRAATREGVTVIAATRERVARGLAELQSAAVDLEAAALGVEAVRFRMMLEALRAHLAASDPAREDVGASAPLPALEGVIVDPDTGMRVGRSGSQLRAWVPLRALRAAWTGQGPAGSLRFGGSAQHRRVFVGTSSTAVLDATNGHLCWTWAGTLFDSWDDTALLGTDAGVELRSLADGTVIRQISRPDPARVGWILPGGLLLGHPAGLVVVDGEGRVLGQGRFGGAVVLSADRQALVAFPMVLRLPDLHPLAGLSRPPQVTLTSYSLEGDCVIGWGDAAVFIWRPSLSPAPMRLPVPVPPTGVLRVGDVLWVHTADAHLAFDLGRWPPVPLDAFDRGRAEALLPLRQAPTRFVAGAEVRIDRVRGTLDQKAELCHELARYAANHAREGVPELREIAAGILRDALVVEAEVLVRWAARLARPLAERPDRPDMEQWGLLLDRLLKPMFLLESLPELFDEASSRRVRGLLAACAGEALSAVGTRMSARATAGKTEDGEIEASMGALSQVRAKVLAHAPGLGWVGLDLLMARWKQLGREARELSDVAVATRALGRLSEASTVIRGADATAGEAALQRLGRSIGDLAARSAADAEVDALLSREGLHEKIADGLERARRELGKR